MFRFIPLYSLPLTPQTTYFLLRKANIPDLCLNIYHKLSGLAVSEVTFFISHVLLGVWCDPSIRPGGTPGVEAEITGWWEIPPRGLHCPGQAVAEQRP